MDKQPASPVSPHLLIVTAVKEAQLSHEPGVYQPIGAYQMIGHGCLAVVHVGQDAHIPDPLLRVSQSISRAPSPHASVTAARVDRIMILLCVSSQSEPSSGQAHRACLQRRELLH